MGSVITSKMIRPWKRHTAVDGIRLLVWNLDAKLLYPSQRVFGLAACAKVIPPRLPSRLLRYPDYPALSRLRNAKCPRSDFVNWSSVVSLRTERRTLDASVTLFLGLAKDVVSELKQHTLSKFFSRSIILPSTSLFDSPVGAE